MTIMVLTLSAESRVAGCCGFLRFGMFRLNCVMCDTLSLTLIPRTRITGDPSGLEKSQDIRARALCVASDSDSDFQNSYQNQTTLC